MEETIVVKAGKVVREVTRKCAILIEGSQDQSARPFDKNGKKLKKYAQ